LPLNKQSDKLAKLMKDELTAQSFVVNVSARNGGRSITGVKADGKQIEIDYNKIDDRFFPTLNIPIKAGRNFSPDYPSDTNEAAIVNESFVKSAGWKTGEAVGKEVSFSEGNRKLTIVGVTRDYHYASLKEKIGPQLFSMDTGMNYGRVWVKIRPENIPKSMASIEKLYKKLVPLFPYDYQFTDSINALNYETEAKWKQIISIAAGLFIFISCMGLFGLVLLSIQQRTKEIGIRKILGAAVSKIVVLISKDFIRLIVIAFLVAIPAGYFAAHEWLQFFPYRISLNGWMFVMAGAFIITIAFATIAFQAIRAGIANPIKNLRTE
jgi:hypothetical protein